MDGDTVGVKGVWLKEDNDQMDAFLKSKIMFINFGGMNIRTSSNEALQCIYSLSKVLDSDKVKLTQPVF